MNKVVLKAAWKYSEGKKYH